MSFFGLDQHNSRAPGFGPTPDPFASLSSRPGVDNDDDALDFEDTYDGLGDELDETDDVLNQDTFGGPSPSQAPVGKDFNFFGQTADMTKTLADEQLLFAARQSTRKASPKQTTTKPTRTGYERYAEPGYIPQLEANASLWSVQAKTPTREAPGQILQPAAVSSKKMMSLDEVEASLRVQSKRPAAPNHLTTTSTIVNASQPPQLQDTPSYGTQEPFARRELPVAPKPLENTGQDTVDQLHQRYSAPSPSLHPAQSLNSDSAGLPPHPRHTPFNQNRVVPQHNVTGLQQTLDVQQRTHLPSMPPRGPIYQGRVITSPEQIMSLSAEERAAFLEEEAKRAKRNHKIYMLAKDNGLMTPQDKNFITRVQLQQLVTATGGADEQGPEVALAEDFYYQVYSQIRSAPRQNPSQPLNHFAQTYLHQTGGRGRNRRYPLGGDNHMRRMEQQVQRAVEAVKMKPKNKQLILEGSLGKISFSNAKTPKPLLNVKRPDSSDARSQSTGRVRTSDSIAQRKAVLGDIEILYTTLLKLEDHERRMPPPLNEESSGDERQGYMDWRHSISELNQTLWLNLKVLEPIIPNSPVLHPFISILSHSKGKKLIPRVFRQLDDQQRLTVLTMVVVHLDMLDVIRLASNTANEKELPRNFRDEIELFSHAVMPSLFSYVSEAAFPIIIGLVGLIIERVHVHVVARTRIGLSLLTMFISRAELIKQSPHVDTTDLDQWNDLYNRVFDILEPHLADIFPSLINSGEDMYVWQFLAAIGIGASPEQQQRLVIAVKDRVMETMAHARSLPDEMASSRLGNVNLFMRAIGLDVDLLA